MRVVALRRRLDLWGCCLWLVRRGMKLKVGLRGGLISLHVQAPCIIVACACRLGRWARATTLDYQTDGVACIFYWGLSWWKFTTYVKPARNRRCRLTPMEERSFATAQRSSVLCNRGVSSPSSLPYNFLTVLCRHKLQWFVAVMNRDHWSDWFLSMCAHCWYEWLMFLELPKCTDALRIESNLI